MLLRFKTRIWAELLSFFQSRCNHGNGAMLADYLEGDCRDIEIKWCRVCGAIQRTGGELRKPQPLWYI